MICPKCGAESWAVGAVHGTELKMHRQRECANGHTFKTVEVHATVVTGDARRLAQFARRVAADVERLQRDTYIAKHLHLGWKVLAKKFNLSKTAVYSAAKRGRENGKIVY